MHSLGLPEVLFVKKATSMAQLKNDQNHPGLTMNHLGVNELKIWDGTSITNLAGLPFLIKIGGGGGDPARGDDSTGGVSLFIDGKVWGVPGDNPSARIMGADMQASNGLIHSMDTVAFVPRTDPGRGRALSH